MLLFVSALVGAGCGDDIELPPPAPLSCADLAAQAIERPEIGECLVTGRGFWVTGVSYAASDGHDTWVQRVLERDGESGVIIKYPYADRCTWNPCLFERTPATGEP